jgi:hypothetical protein
MLRIENNKGFFEGAALAERKSASDQERQLAEAEYARNLQEQMAMQRIRGNMYIQDAGERAQFIDDVNMREKNLQTQGTSKDLWLIQDDGTMAPANVNKVKAIRQANLQREYDMMQRPDGTLKNQFSIYGTSYDPNLGRFMQTNPQGHGITQYLPGGKKIWGSVHTSNLPLQVR